MQQKYDHLSVESLIRTEWQTREIYQQVDSSKQLYSVDTPPPTVSGSLHIGHIFSTNRSVGKPLSSKPKG